MTKTATNSNCMQQQASSSQASNMGNLEFSNKNEAKDRDQKPEVLKAVLVQNESTTNTKEQRIQCVNETTTTMEHTNRTTCATEGEGSHTTALVPVTSSLPCRLLKLNAKRIAHAIRQDMDSATQADHDSPSCSKTSNAKAIEKESFSAKNSDKSLSSVMVMSEDALDERNDAGMGSSIECSEESEEDDELKPLAIDNHVIYNQTDEANLPAHRHHQDKLLDQSSTATATSKELNQTNLEQFQKSQHSQMENIYLHPNFQYANASAASTLDKTLPTETKRPHRSFLTMKKSTVNESIADKDNSALSQSSNASESKSNAINEIDTLDAALIPNDDLAIQITKAVEFYFTDDSILKDAFLLKHVRRNKEGFVSLKLISSFKLVRQLTKDWRVVGHAVRRKSRKVELNDLGTKVRRLEPLPSFDETMPSRTIVACDLPMDKLTIEKVSDIFSKYGEIALIRILKPGMAIPVDVRQFMNKYPEMQQKQCALVEYLESAAAREARSIQGPFKVYEMVAPKKKTGKKAIVQLPTPIVRMVENYRQFNEQHGERTRGGSFSGPVRHEFNTRYKLKRYNSDVVPAQPPPSPFYYPSDNFAADYNQQHSQYLKTRAVNSQDTSTTNTMLTGMNANYYNHGARRYSTASTFAANESPLPAHSQIANVNTTNNNSGTFHGQMRRYSNAPQDGVGYSDVYRRLSKLSVDSRRESSGSESYMYARRSSDYGHNDIYRKDSHGSVMNSTDRRYSNNHMQYERNLSNSNDNTLPMHRLMSSEYSIEGKPTMEIHDGNLYDECPDVDNYNAYPRRYSNNFNNNININSKLAAYDNAQYINGRRMSTDSGYDRRFSFGSEYEGSPRSRTGSFLNNYKNQNGDFETQSPRSRTNSFLEGAGTPRSRSGSFAQRAAESLVRTPIGPDGSKGFANRMRKAMETVASVN